jgi:endo-1,4-beta-xylanase
LIRATIILALITHAVACSSGQGKVTSVDAATLTVDTAGVDPDAENADVPVMIDVGKDIPLAVSPPAGKFVGNITTRRQVRDDFTHYWNQITPENEGKWGSVERTQGTMNWSALDALYAFARSHNVIFKEHCFVWGSQQPAWVNNDNGLAAVKNWISSFCQRYPDTALIDVVNEPPPHTTPAYMDSMGGAGASGWDWIVNAFTWAREACPNATLILNDYDNAENADSAQHTIDIVKAIMKAGAPIDAIGCQAHGTVDLSAADLRTNVDRMADETGLPVYITEYDINLADDERQKSVMQDQFTMFWENPNIKGITLWGYVYGSTWMENTGLVLADGTPRPAMSWLVDYLGL